MLPSTFLTGPLRIILVGILGIGGFLTLFVMYYQSAPSQICPPQPALPHHYSNPPENSSLSKKQPEPDKPIMLLWFWPENRRFDFSDCTTFFNIDGCQLTDDRSLYNKADGVLIFHKSIKHDLSNLPPSPRPPFQKWIWYHVESPTNTIRIPGLENLFNLTLSYREDADIPVRWRLTARKGQGGDFVLPKKDKLVCWIVSNNNPATGTAVRDNYYRELVKHIKVDVYGKAFARFLRYEDYYSTLSSCKFYLSFENSVHRDYITEKLNGPLAAGTVPVVLGPPRQNYEDFVPGDSFIHVNDFPNAKALAEFLLKLDKDDEAYLRYFQWRRNLFAQQHLIQLSQEFIQSICYACDHVGKHKEYRVVHNIYKWYFG
ncbi:4-galactosyl-N-acetylglucosaminide 3-alpha-L-fucosyltransferase 9 [Oncorhynchus tshawytscha]|uniref:Fucosyltransferase n=1 Tax=Oncorhynchus tshawytscha TaxID=74940 RepID=A0AAZ3P6V7_ONCTS|nr:4-galactosyl-N-acetylglucosaminide 3-alpha-L-fucosyltransferase 9 [Oncorhynchus tshawytscha]XP_024234259.1 4-galactosyl-N-acetylglucosaminide 3-alpha-L-fucosyltransferase 9 [Oncorhynchus tshawytscha]